jgi:hypothetical protein
LDSHNKGAYDATSSVLVAPTSLKFLSEAVRQELDAMFSRKHYYISDFARTYFAQGWAEGRDAGLIEGRAAMALRLLSLRFGVPSQTMQWRVHRASIPDLDALAERILSASSMSEALGKFG